MTKGFLENHGHRARFFFLNILFATMTFLAALFAGTLSASEGEGDDAKARYEVCALAGATADHTCPAIPADDTTGETVYNIAVAISVINALLLIWSVAGHYNYGAYLLEKGQWLFSILNIGLFAGLVGNLNSVEDILDEVNLENNVLFSGANPYVIAVVGLSAGVLEFVLFNSLNLWYFKRRCDVRYVPDSGDYGSGN
jgi:hypothetical protein